MACMLSLVLSVIYIYIHGVQPKTINCPDNGQCGPCTDLTPGETCTLDCQGSYHCHYFQTAVCTDGHPCEILCTGDNACDGLMVYANKATSVYWKCDSERKKSNTNNNCCVRSQLWAADVTGDVEIDCSSPNDNSNNYNGNCNQMNVTCGSGDCSIDCSDISSSGACDNTRIDASLSTSYQCSGTECANIVSIQSADATSTNPTSTDQTIAPTSDLITSSDQFTPEFSAISTTPMRDSTETMVSSTMSIVELFESYFSQPSTSMELYDGEVADSKSSRESAEFYERSSQTDTFLGFGKMVIFIACSVIFLTCFILCAVLSYKMYGNHGHNSKHKDGDGTNIDASMALEMAMRSTLDITHNINSRSVEATSPVSMSAINIMNEAEIVTMPDCSGNNHSSIPTPISVQNDDIMPNLCPVLVNKMESVASIESDYDIDLCDVMTPEGIYNHTKNHLGIIMDNQEDDHDMDRKGEKDMQEVEMDPDEFVIEGDHEEIEYLELEADEFVIEDDSDRKQTIGGSLSNPNEGILTAM